MKQPETICYALMESLNEYNQDGAYLRYVWKEKPTVEEVAIAASLTFPNVDKETELKVIKLWQGEQVRFDSYGSHWELVPLTIGVQKL